MNWMGANAFIATALNTTSIERFSSHYLLYNQSKNCLTTSSHYNKNILLKVNCKNYLENDDR